MTNDDRQIRRVLAKNVLAASSRDGTAVARFSRLTPRAEGCSGKHNV
jgi:hypothetical protein